MPPKYRTTSSRYTGYPNSARGSAYPGAGGLDSHIDGRWRLSLRQKPGRASSTGRSQPLRSGVHRRGNVLRLLASHYKRVRGPGQRRPRQYGHRGIGPSRFRSSFPHDAIYGRA